MTKPATIKLTEWNGDPLYVCTAWVVAVRKPRTFEMSDPAMASGTRVELSGIFYLVRESIETVVELLAG